VLRAQGLFLCEVKMANQAEDATRHILDVDVKEVSLVDRAANLRQFLVVKRLEEGELMGAFAEERREDMNKNQEVLKAGEKELTEEEKAKLEAEKEKKKKQKEKEDEKEVAEKDSELKEEKEKEDKEKAMQPKALAGMLRKLSGAPKGPVSELISWLESKTKQDPMEDEEEEDEEMKGKEKKTQKNLEGVQVAVMDDGSVVVSGQPVTKSKKFTPARMAAMKEMAMQLMKLIGDVDSNTAKDIMEAIKELPKDKSVPSSVRPVNTSKSVESEVVKQLQEENVKLEKRIEEIEKTRMPSKSVEDNGGTDQKAVKKSLWSGVL